MSCCSLIVSVSILRCWSFVFIGAFWTWDYDCWKHTSAREAGDSLHLTDDTAQSDHTQGFRRFFAFTLSCNRVKPAENKARSVLPARLWCPLSTSSYYAVGAFPLWFASHLPPFLAVTPPLHLQRFELSGTSANWFKYTSALLQNEMTGRTPCPQKLHETWKGFLGS